MKVLLEAPILTQSGYGEHARLVFQALMTIPALQVYTNPLNWGSTSWSISTDLEKDIHDSINILGNYIDECKKSNTQTEFDIQIHVGIPSEFEKKAPYSVCVTAGIETDRVSAEWIVRTHRGIDKIIVPSEHAKSGFTKTSYEIINQQKQQRTVVDCKCPVEVVPYPVKKTEIKHLDFKTETDFNFLSIALLGPRKNLENMVKWFVEEFENQNVGLILKTGRSRGNPIDRNMTIKHLENITPSPEERKCKIYLLHGDLEESEIHSLYAREDIHAYVSSTHGEGFGLPIFEAAYSGMPIVATNWSAHTEFLSAPYKEGGKVKEKSLFAKVDYDLNTIPKSAVWENILVEGSSWAFPKESSFKKQLRNMYKNYGMYKKWAKALQSHILKTHESEKILHNLKSHLLTSEMLQQLEDSDCEISELPKISIITSVYNGDEYIKQFLEDIEKQTIFKEKCELVLVNGNSPGNEENIILEFKKKYPDNVVYKKLDQDPGIYACWNEAIKLSTGEYLTNANLDDRKDPSFLEKLAKQLFLDKDVSVVYADNLITHVSNETWTNNTAKEVYPSEQFSLEALLRGNPPHCMPMWRSSLHSKYGYFNEEYRSASDWEFWLRCSFAGENMKKINKKLGLYYFNPNGMSTNPENDEWKRKEEREIFKKYLNIFQERMA